MSQSSIYTPKPHHFALAVIVGILCAFVILADRVGAQSMTGAPATDCPTSPNAFGAGCVIVETSTHIAATGGVPGNFGVVIYSTVALPPTPFGDGLLCVAPFVQGSGRTVARVFGESGAATHRLPPGGVGETRYAQVWYRDLGGNGNSSNSLIVNVAP